MPGVSCGLWRGSTLSKQFDKKIAGFRRDGAVDSSGEFSLNETRRRQLEEQSYVAEPTDVVTILLRAFGNLPAHYQEISIGVTGVKFVMWCDGSPPYDVELLEDLLEGRKRTEDPYLFLLVLALRSATKHFYQIKLRVGDARSLTISGGKVSSKTMPDESRLWRVQLNLSRKNLLKGFKDKVFRLTGHHSIFSRGFAYPKALLVDTLPVTRGWFPKPPGTFNWDTKWSAYHYLADGFLAAGEEWAEISFPLHHRFTHRTREDGWRECVEVSDEGDHFVLSEPVGEFCDAPVLFRYREPGVKKHTEGFEPHGYIAKSRFNNSIFKSTQSNQNSWLVCGVAFAIPMHLQGPGRLYLLDRGVSLDPVEVDLGCPGILCVASAAGLQTDLSGLRVVKNEAFNEKVERLRRAAAEFVAKTREISHLFKPLAIAAGYPGRKSSSHIDFVRPHIETYVNTVTANFPSIVG